MRHTRVLLVDDHTAVRQALRMMLESEADMVVVGEAGDGAEGVAVAATLEPDVTIVDLAMPGMGGLAAIPSIAEGVAADGDSRLHDARQRGLRARGDAHRRARLSPEERAQGRAAVARSARSVPAVDISSPGSPARC